MNFSFFTVFLKNRNISSKIKRLKVTDYAALNKGVKNSMNDNVLADLTPYLISLVSFVCLI